MRVSVAFTIWSTLLLLPTICFADSGIIVKESLWRLIAEDSQVAVIKLDRNGLVDVNLFISIVDKSGKSNTLHLVLPFRDRPLSLRAEELVLTEFKRQHVEAIESRQRQIQFARSLARTWIENGFCVSLALGFPLGLLVAEALKPHKPSALPPGLTLGAVKAIKPELVVTTEHTRTEVYRIERPTDIEQLLKETGISREQLERLKRQTVGRYLYLVTVKTVPLGSDQQTLGSESRPYSQPIRQEERLGVVFHVQLETQRRGHELTFTYPLGTGETWWHPISLTELFFLAPPDGSLDIRFPKLANKQVRGWQETFIGRDKFGHIVRLTYGNANPSEDVVVKFDPTKRSKIPTAETAEKVGRIAWLFFFILLATLWFPSLWLFASLAANRTMSVGLFLRETPAVGFLWGVLNGFFGLGAWASLEGTPLTVRILKLPWQWGDVELMLLLLLILVLATLFVFAFLPSMRLYRVKLLAVVFGILLVSSSIFIFAALVPIIVLFIALPVSSLVVYFWLKREGESLPTYWQCLTFSFLFGIMFFVVSLMVRNILLTFVYVRI